MLEDLEHNYLGELQQYRFAHSLAQSVEPIRDQIRENSYSELKDFLEGLQTIVCQRIGEGASRHVSIKLNVLILIYNHILMDNEMEFFRLRKKRKFLAT